MPALPALHGDDEPAAPGGRADAGGNEVVRRPHAWRGGQTAADEYERRWLLLPAGVLTLMLVGIGISLLGRAAWGPAEPPPAPPQSVPDARLARLVVETAVPGARVLIDGAVRGTTPLDLAVPPGRLNVEVEEGGRRRGLRVELAPDSRATYFFDLATRQPVASRGAGTSQRGPTPSAGGSAGRRPSGSSGDRVAPTTGRLGGPALGQGNAVDHRRPTAGGDTAGFGWLVVRSPIDLQVVERDAVVGGSGAGSLRLAAGQHDLLMVSEPFEFRATQRVVVPAGGTVALDVQVPDGVASFNAQPWAEVWVGGQRLGETPLGNVRLPVGHYDVVFRHPQFGERRAVAVVRASTPERVTVSFER